MFYQLWKFKLDPLLINHLITENNLYGMVTRRSLRYIYFFIYKTPLWWNNWLINVDKRPV